MKVGDMIRIVRTNSPSWAHRNDSSGLIVDIGEREYSCGNRRIATILHGNGEVQSWPLDSFYKIEVINDA